MEPHDHPRRILLAVTGLSPQVVTETFYWLAVQRRPMFMPTEIRLITTAEGADRARLELLHPDSGRFHRLRRDYELPRVHFKEDGIHVIEDSDGRPLTDIRGPADNTSAADCITAIVRELTQDDDCALHVSIAGGRKTMGYYLGYALSLYGRAQDRLSHVLVNAPYESHPEFFYPTPRSRVIHSLADGRPFDTRDAQVTVADIPFVRLRDGLNGDLLTGQASFSSVVAEAQRAVPPVRLILDPAARTVVAGGEQVVLSPRRFALYWMLAERALRGRPGIHWSEPEVAAELLAYYRSLVGEHSAEYERAESAFGRGLDGGNLNPDKSHINKDLERHLGRRRAAPYLIATTGQIPGTRYRRIGLTLAPDAIEVGGPTRRDASGSAASGSAKPFDEARHAASPRD
ncbi:MAG: CRISPR-associated ring nuclease Csm6 [Rhodospirillales bacterium]|nr:CRISPR-associated ring nuclease Csm6 [Rhodospirillales bacterium]